VPGKDIIAVTRKPEALADLAAKGVVVRLGSFDEIQMVRMLLPHGASCRKNAVRKRELADCEFKDERLGKRFRSLLERNRYLLGVIDQTGNSWISERSGLAAK
jgi:hypothetical protein